MASSEVEQQALRHIQNKVDLNEVHQSDLSYVELILRDVECFEPREVGMTYDVKRVGNCYSKNAQKFVMRQF